MMERMSEHSSPPLRFPRSRHGHADDRLPARSICPPRSAWRSSWSTKGATRSCCPARRASRPTTHQPEKNDLTDAVREAVGDRAFILCGACSNDTAHAVRIGEGAQEHGADGLLDRLPVLQPPLPGGPARARARRDGCDRPARHALRHPGAHGHRLLRRDPRHPGPAPAHPGRQGRDGRRGDRRGAHAPHGPGVLLRATTA